MWMLDYRAYSDGMSACNSDVLRCSLHGVSVRDRLACYAWARHAISTRRALLPDVAAPSARRPSSAARLPSRQQLHIHQNNSVQRDRAAHARAYQTRYRASVNLHRADEMPPRCPAVRWRPWLASTGSSAMVQHIFGAEPWPERARNLCSLARAAASALASGPQDIRIGK